MIEHRAGNKKLSWCWQTRATRLEVNIIPFRMLRIVSSCAIGLVTLSLRRAGFPIYDFKKFRDLEIRVRVTQGHWCGTILQTGCCFLLVFYRNFVRKKAWYEMYDFRNAVTLKTGLVVRQGHWKRHHAIERIW